MNHASDFGYSIAGQLPSTRDPVERRMPPHPRGVVEMLRARGHVVTIRENLHGSLRYTLDGERERTAHELSNRLRALHGV